jgi:hypothetical protein
LASTPHLGPPMDPASKRNKNQIIMTSPYVPIRTASASLHALRVEGGRGSPVASIAHPPNKCDSSFSSKSGVPADIVFSTLTASPVTSGPATLLHSDFFSLILIVYLPMPSPAITATRKLVES